MSRLLLLCLLLLTSLPVQAATVTLDEHRARVRVPSLLWLDDMNRDLSAEEALDWFQDGFGQPLAGQAPTLGRQPHAQWFLIRLHHDSPWSHWMLRAGTPDLDYLDVYLFSADQRLLQHWRQGDRLPFTARPVQQPDLITPLRLPTGPSQLLLRAQSQGSLHMPVELLTPVALAEDTSRRHLSTLVAGGGLLALAAWLLFRSLGRRQPDTALLALYLGILLLNLLSRRGLAFQWLWPDAPVWNHYSLPVLNLLTLATALLGTMALLNLKRQQPSLHRLLQGLVLLSLLLLPMLPWLGSLMMVASELLLLVGIAVLLAVAVREWVRQHPPAGTVMAAFLFLGLVALTLCLDLMGLVQGTPWLPLTLQGLVLIHAFLLTMAQEQRSRALETARLQALREQRDQLDQRSRDRSLALYQALDRQHGLLTALDREVRPPLERWLQELVPFQDHPQLGPPARSLAQTGTQLLRQLERTLTDPGVHGDGRPGPAVPMSLEPLLTESLELFRHRATEAGTSLAWHLAADARDPVLGDPLLLRQLLELLARQALLRNPGGQVRLHVRRAPRDSRLMQLDLSHTGPDLSPSEQEQLLRGQPGAVNGDQDLALCRHLVLQLGGELQWHSQGQCGGCLTIRLPLPPLEARSPMLSAPDQPLRWLVVDDNPVQLQVIHDLCRQLGHQAELAESGGEALALLRNDPRGFDLILIDCDGHDRSGLALARELVALQQGLGRQAAPILAQTPPDHPGLNAACLAAGVAATLPRPLTRSALEKALHGLYASAPGADDS